VSVARHHSEWLSLVETSGPFLSLPVLLRVFPQGLDRRDPERAGRLREAYEDWLERGAKSPAVHQAWIKHVLRDLLEYPESLLVEGQAIPPGIAAAMPTFGETLRPELVLKHRDADHKPVLLITIYPPTQDLEKPVVGKLWKASAGTRMMELLHATDVPLGLVTNGEEWMLVSASRGETTGFASWYADLWMQEPLTLRAFQSLLHLRRMMGVADSDTLAALFVESSKDQQEVTNQLGHQVRQAVEVLVQAFDRINAESGRILLADVTEKALYDSALTVMMRLVFLFSAEERGLLMLGDPLYDQNYALSTLSELLRERADQHGEEILERRHDAWCRLIATFRAVHGGVEHEAMRLPAYGGTLFDPDRYPFLEGRAAGTSWRTDAAQPLLINNRVVLHLLEALQLLRVKVPGGGPAEARRLSFRALDIEQIGHVYEGLLDHTAKRAHEPILGLAGSKDNELDIPLAKLEEIAASGTAALVEFLKEETGRSEKALKRLIDEGEALGAEHALLIACGQDHSLYARFAPFAGLLRTDSFGQPVVVSAGSVWVTSGTDRRSTGTHYTPRSLTQPIVKYTLEPLVYVGPAEGLPEAEWNLRTPKEILALKVCDMAMGSGAFLVEACRYLAERLVEAWEHAEQEHPDSFVVTPDGELSTGSSAERLIPADAAERITIARRYIADRCLYGVDINPMAVEMAKLSIWLVTLQRDRPFSFLDHALKCGDSLVGVNSVDQIERFSLRADEQQVSFATANLFRYVEEASAKRRALEGLPSNDHSQIEEKARLHAEAEVATTKVKGIADCLIAFEFLGLDGDAYKDARHAEAEHVQLLIKRDADIPNRRDDPGHGWLAQHAHKQLEERRPFHWPVEFPEVFSDGGFNAFVGNPPFMGGSGITGVWGALYRDYLVRLIANGKKGNADIVAYFFLRATILARLGSCVGLVATKTVAQGETREIGLEQLLSNEFVIYRANASCPWPGPAALAVAHAWLRRGTWEGLRFLDGLPVSNITSYLSDQGAELGPPKKLKANAEKSFTGTKIYGEGFLVTPALARELIDSEPRSKDVLLQYLNGEDLNSDPRQCPSRWTINFGNRTLEEAQLYKACFSIALSKVKPYRETVNESRTRERWWLFERPRDELYEAIGDAAQVLVCSEVTKHLAFCFVPSGSIFSANLDVFPYADYDSFAVMQSSLHEMWARFYCSHLETRLKYSPGNAFETFPFPALLPNLKRLGQLFHEQRRQIMLTHEEGLTKTYNRFHDTGEKSKDVEKLRALLIEMDLAVAAAFGWSDLMLGHGFHETKQGTRYTITEPARRTVLNRLLTLNHQRYGEEVKGSLHQRATKKPKFKAVTTNENVQGSFLV
jgi:hypothetical protein